MADQSPNAGHEGTVPLRRVDDRYPQFVCLLARAAALADPGITEGGTEARCRGQVERIVARIRSWPTPMPGYWGDSEAGRLYLRACELLGLDPATPGRTPDASDVRASRAGRREP